MSFEDGEIPDSDIDKCIITPENVVEVRLAVLAGKSNNTAGNSAELHENAQSPLRRTEGSSAGIRDTTEDIPDNLQLQSSPPMPAVDVEEAETQELSVPALIPSMPNESTMLDVPKESVILAGGRQRHIRGNRGDLIGFLRRDRRLHGRYRVSEDSEDSDFEVSEMPASMKAPDSPSSQLQTEIPSSSPPPPARLRPQRSRVPEQWLHQDPGELSPKPHRLVYAFIDSDFSSDNESEAESGEDDNNSRPFQRRVTSEQPASHRLVDTSSQDLSQPFDEPYLFNEVESHLQGEVDESRLGEADEGDHIDYMLSRPTPLKSGARKYKVSRYRPQKLSVVQLCEFAGSRASRALRVAARTARRSGAREDEPRHKFISVGASAQRSLREWANGDLVFNTQPQSRTTAPRERLPNEQTFVVPSRKRPRSDQELQRRGDQNHKLGSSRKQKSRKSSKPSKRMRSIVSDSRQYATVELEIPAMEKLHWRSAQEGLDKRLSTSNEHHGFARESEFGVQKAADWLNAQESSSSTQSTGDLRVNPLPCTHLNGSSVYGSIFDRSDQPKFIRHSLSSIIRSWNDVKNVVKGVTGAIDEELYNHVYDFVLAELKLERSPPAKLMEIIRLHAKDNLDWTTRCRLIVSAAFVAFNKASETPAVDVETIAGILFAHLHVICAESRQKYLVNTESIVSRATPGIEFVLGAAVNGYLSGIYLENALSDGSWTLQQRWCYALVAAASGMLPEWRSLRVLVSTAALERDARLAMLSYLRLVTEFGWGPSVTMVVSLFEFFAKHHRPDPRGEKIELPALLWKSEFNGRVSSSKGQYMFLEVLGTTLRCLRRAGRVVECCRIAGRVTPLARLAFPATAHLSLADVATVAQQYCILLILMRECPAEARRSVAQIRDVVDIRGAHVLVRALALSAWKSLVLVCRDDNNKLAECASWMDDIVQHAVREVEDGQQSVPRVLAETARVASFVIDSGAFATTAIPLRLLDCIAGTAAMPTLRHHLWQVPHALSRLATPQAVDLLVAAAPNMRQAAQFSNNDLAEYFEVACVLWNRSPDIALEWPGTGKSSLYIALLHLAAKALKDDRTTGQGQINSKLVCHAVMVLAQPSWSPDDAKYVFRLAEILSLPLTGRSTLLEGDRLPLLRKLLALQPDIEVGDALLKNLEQHYIAHPEFPAVRGIRKVVFDLFPSLRQRSGSWFSGDAESVPFETVDMYVSDAVRRGTLGTDAVVFFTYRLKRSLAVDRGRSFGDELLSSLDELSAADERAAAQMVTRDILGGYFDVALTSRLVVEPFLDVLVGIAHRILNRSDDLRLLPFEFLNKVCRFLNFCIRATLSLNEFPNIQRLVATVYDLALSVVRQTCVANVERGTADEYTTRGDTVIVAFASLLVRWESDHQWLRPIPPEPSPASKDVCDSLRDLNYDPPPANQRAVDLAVKVFKEQAAEYEWTFVKNKPQYLPQNPESSPDVGGLPAYDAFSWTDQRLIHRDGWRPRPRVEL